MKKIVGLTCLLILLAACQSALGPAETALPASTNTVFVPTQSALPATTTATQKPTPAATSTPEPSLNPQQWQEWPVIPQKISPKTLAIYQKGQELGENPQAFSKIGDCESTPAWFMGAFDGNPSDYSLGPYTELAAVIQAFHGSFGRTSLASGRGFSSVNALTALWADQKVCEKNETPLACEVRLNRPSFALIMLGTNDIYHQDVFEKTCGRSWIS